MAPFLSWCALTAAVAVAVQGTAACGAARWDDDDTETTSTIRQAAYFRETTLAPTNPTVCFYQDSSYAANEEEMNQLMTKWSQWMRVWETVSSVRFDVRGRCSAPNPDGTYPEDIRIGVVDGTIDTNKHRPGTDCPARYETADTCDIPAWWNRRKKCAFNAQVGWDRHDGRIAHEIGHCLGFADEDHRWISEKVGGVPVCVGPRPDSEVSAQLFVGPPDSSSRMMYGACCTNPGGLYLSPLDRLTAEIAYPKTTHVPLRVDGVAYDGGWAVLESGSVKPDWILRGAYQNVFVDPLWLVFHDLNTILVHGVDGVPGTSMVEEEWSQVTFQFTDPWGRMRGGVESVMRSPSKHTAVVSGIL